ncbi:hypothetical protein V6N13_074537 [Hibiscus sabdariffa]|uniref:RING-type domain-containing protein n=1 Tax=Hibiscus sabdariffa TaxID=183260 RepID=A0ABR2U8P6_9ROSI
MEASKLSAYESVTACLESEWKEELKAKELALAQLEQERRSKEVAEASNKRKLEALAQSIELNHQSDNLLTGKSEEAKPQGEPIARLLHELDKQQGSFENEVVGDRECIISSKFEFFVVFLPCAHQVLYARCNDSYGKKGKSTCPCCRVSIEQRIRVFGAAS